MILISPREKEFYSVDVRVRSILLNFHIILDFIRPICLPTSDISILKDPVEWLQFAAWGTALKRSPVKLQVSFPFVPQEVCLHLFFSFFLIRCL